MIRLYNFMAQSTPVRRNGSPFSNMCSRKKRTLWAKSERSHSNICKKATHTNSVRAFIYLRLPFISKTIRLFGLRWHSRCDFICVRQKNNNNSNNNGIDNVKSVLIIAHDLMNHPANQMETFCCRLQRPNPRTHTQRLEKDFFLSFFWIVERRKKILSKYYWLVTCFSFVFQFVIR